MIKFKFAHEREKNCLANCLITWMLTYYNHLDWFKVLNWFKTHYIYFKYSQKISNLLIRNQTSSLEIAQKVLFQSFLGKGFKNLKLRFGSEGFSFLIRLDLKENEVTAKWKKWIGLFHDLLSRGVEKSGIKLVCNFDFAVLYL